MKPKFDEKLKLENKGKRLEVCGPNGWEGAEQSAEVHVLIAGDVVAKASSPPRTTRSESEWMLKARVEGDGKLRSGTKGKAAAVAIARDASGKVVDVVSWVDEVTFE